MAEETPTKLPGAAPPETSNPLKREADPDSGSADGKRAKLGNSEATSTQDVSDSNSSGFAGGAGHAETSPTSLDAAADVVMGEVQLGNDESPRERNQTGTHANAPTDVYVAQRHAGPESTEGTSTASAGAGVIASTNQDTAAGVSAGGISASASGTVTGSEKGADKAKAKSGKKGRVGTREKAERNAGRRGTRGAPKDAGMCSEADACFCCGGMVDGFILLPCIQVMEQQQQKKASLPRLRKHRVSRSVSAHCS